MKNNKSVLQVQCAFLYNLYEHDRKFPFATLFGGRKHRDKFNFFADSELGCGPQDSVGKFAYICHFKRVDGNKLEKVKKKTRIHFDVFVPGPRRRLC